jgi:rhodanese-related sulfurtransferase
MKHITLAELTPADYPYLIDVRSAYDYEQGHLPGSINIPLAGLRRATDEIAALPKAILVCNRGKTAQQAAEILESLDIKNVSVLEGGVAAWKAAGKPLSLSARASNAPCPKKMRLAGAGLLLLAAFPALRIVTVIAGLFLFLHSFKAQTAEPCPFMVGLSRWGERLSLIKKLLP